MARAQKKFVVSFPRDSSTMLRMTKFFGCARNKSMFGRTYKRTVQLRRRDKTDDRDPVERSFNVHSFKGHLFTHSAYSKCSYKRNVLIRSERSQGERRDKRRARRLYERLRRVVAELAHKAWWHNKGTILFYASADFPSSSDV